METPLKPRPLGARKPNKQEIDARNQTGSGERPPERSGYYKTFDGTKLFYSIEGDGEPIVFCYGLVCSSLHWTYQIDHFKKTHQAIWFDYRGHHNSEIPTDLKSLTLENMAKDLGLLLDELKIKQATLVAHSMGVNVALELYHQQPERVRALVLANGTPKRPLETLLNTNNILPGGFQFLRSVYAKSPALFSKLWKLQRGNPLLRSIVTFGGFNPHLTPPEDIERYVSQIEEMDPSILLQVLDAYDAYDATPWLHTIQVPTLVIAGDEDKVIPPSQQELIHQLIPGSQFERIRHGSHCPQMDLPELINLKIEKFLAEISGR